MDINDCEKQKLFDYLRWNSYLSERYKLFYVSTPKVACTSLKWWFANLEGYSQALRTITDSIETDPDLIVHESHKVAPHVTGLLAKDLTEALTSESYFRFAIVRNPYKRIFSAWQSKLLLQEPLQIGPYSKFDFFHHTISHEHDIAAAFEGFLEHLVSNENPSYWDHHWTPQATLLRPDLINYTKLVRIENSEKLSKALADWLGEYVPDPFAGRRSNESLIPYLPAFVTDRSADLIRQLYAVDFDVFGYEKQLPLTQETFSTDQFALAIKAIKLIRARHQRLGERTEQITNLGQAVAERDRQIANLGQAVAERDRQIANLGQAVAERDRQIANLNEVKGEFDRKISILDTKVIENLSQVKLMEQELCHTASREKELNAALVKCEEELAKLNHMVANRDDVILKMWHSLKN